MPYTKVEILIEWEQIGPFQVFQNLHIITVNHVDPPAPNPPSTPPFDFNEFFSPIENGPVNPNEDPMVLASISTTTVTPESNDPVNESNDPVNEEPAPN